MQYITASESDLQRKGGNSAKLNSSSIVKRLIELQYHVDFTQLYKQSQLKLPSMKDAVLINYKYYNDLYQTDIQIIIPYLS